MEINLGVTERRVFVILIYTNFYLRIFNCNVEFIVILDDLMLHHADHVDLDIPAE